MLDVALKEWAIVCDLLLEGRLAFLLRKGGIHESGGPGVFALEHPRFALFPSWAHQKPQMIKEAYRERVEVLAEPDELALIGMGVATKVWRVPSRQAFDNLEAFHPWTREQIDMRFNYKPQNPLYLVAVRAYRLTVPREIRMNPEYAGCKSWVPLRPGDEADDRNATPAIEHDAYERTVERIDESLRGG
ncbi:MAG: DUF1802 family protein [Phycisphaera sp.]|nr:DUF1802 family protein [Phycisphaera sp.]